MTGLRAEVTAIVDELRMIRQELDISISHQQRAAHALEHVSAGLEFFLQTVVHELNGKNDV